jgi:RhoGEF domain/Calponin homology (CH) domain
MTSFVVRRRDAELKIIADLADAREWVATVIGREALRERALRAGMTLRGRGMEDFDAGEDDDDASLSPDQFFAALRDGEVLCLLVAEILYFEPGKPSGGTADKKRVFVKSLLNPGGRTRKGARMVATHRLSAFVDSCADKLGIPRDQLFVPEDLLLSRNLPQVVSAILALGEAAEAQKSFRPGLHRMSFLVLGSGGGKKNAAPGVSSRSTSAPGQEGRFESVAKLPSTRIQNTSPSDIESTVVQGLWSSPQSSKVLESSASTGRASAPPVPPRGSGPKEGTWGRASARAMTSGGSWRPAGLIGRRGTNSTARAETLRADSPKIGTRSWKQRAERVSTEQGVSGNLSGIEKYYHRLKADAESLDSDALSSRIESIREQEQRDSEDVGPPESISAIISPAVADKPEQFLEEWMPSERVGMRDEAEETPEDVRRELKRIEVLTELLATERTYVRDIDAMVGFFLVPSREFEVLSPALQTDIFSNVELILDVNQAILTSLLRDLETCASIQLVCFPPLSFFLFFLSSLFHTTHSCSRVLPLYPPHSPRIKGEHRSRVSPTRGLLEDLLHLRGKPRTRSQDG